MKVKGLSRAHPSAGGSREALKTQNCELPSSSYPLVKSALGGKKGHHLCCHQ